MSIFRKCHIKLFLIVKVGDPFWLWLHFYSVFEMSPKSVFYYFGLSWARLEKCIIQSAENLRITGSFLLTFFEFWNLISRIFIFQGPANRFWGLGTFWGVQKSSIYLPFWTFSMNLGWSVVKVDRIYGIFDMALALFHKQLYKIQNNCKRGIGKIWIFIQLNCLLNCLLNCP